MKCDFTDMPQPEPVPPGWYWVEIEEAEESVTNKGNEFIMLRMVVLDGPQLRRSVFCRLYNTEAGRRWTQRFCKAAGFPADELIELTPKMLVGKQVEIRVRLTEYEGETRVEVVAYPHLHVVYRGSFMPQRWISQMWQACGGGRIVDVRKVEHPSQVYRYILTYLTKQAGREAPKGFRRVRTSRHFFDGARAAARKKEHVEWLLARFDLDVARVMLREDGYRVQEVGECLRFEREME